MTTRYDVINPSCAVDAEATCKCSRNDWSCVPKQQYFAMRHVSIRTTMHRNRSAPASLKHIPRKYQGIRGSPVA